MSIKFSPKFVAGQATSHYLNQWWLVYWRIYASLGLNELTRWNRVTHICASKLIIIGTDNGLSSGRRQAISWTNTEILLIKCRLQNGVYFVSASMS